MNRLKLAPWRAAKAPNYFVPVQLSYGGKTSPRLLKSPHNQYEFKPGFYPHSLWVTQVIHGHFGALK